MTRLAALEQTVIALCVKQPFFIKTRFLKTVVHIGREYKIIFFGYEPVQRIVNGPWGIFITVDLDIPAPVRPVLFRSGISIKAAGIHIMKTVLCFKITEIPVKAFPGICKSRRGGKPRTRTDENGVGRFKRLLQPFRFRKNVFFCPGTCPKHCLCLPSAPEPLFFFAIHTAPQIFFVTACTGHRSKQFPQCRQCSCAM